MGQRVCTGTVLATMLLFAGVARSVEPIPNRLVVLTFDDSVKSHFTVVRPILKRHGFGATFFITEGFDFATNKTDYMSWEEIATLDREGFEIGNHTRDHMAVTEADLPRLSEQIAAIQQRCAQHGIAQPISFAFPGNAFVLGALPILSKAGFRFARRGTEPELPYEAGGGLAYEPGLDHPLLIPTAGDARPGWELSDFERAVRQGQGGRIAVLQFHGVPDRAHPWVHTAPEKFAAFMQYLADKHYTVIAMRDLAKYIPAGSEPTDPEMVIRDRQQKLAAKKPCDNFRTPHDEADLRYWLTNMVVYHHFTLAEMVAATGLPEQDIQEAIDRFQLDPSKRPQRRADDPLTVVPYPGGRHPRIGFRDGEIRPQRETKCSVFTPWNPRDYVVLDIPEAIWIDSAGGPQLLYLAHTHIPTMWDKQGIDLPPLEWTRHAGGDLSIERPFPNGVTLAARVHPTATAVHMELAIHNPTEKTLTGLRVQNCVMLSNAAGFDQQANDNKQFRRPYAVCRDAAAERWIITAWQPCQRSWGNEQCPCLHSDPQFPDCPPGQTRRVVGWLSFYEGNDIDKELDRIDALHWWQE